MNHNDTVEVEVILMQHKLLLRCRPDEEARLHQVVALLNNHMQALQAQNQSLSFERTLLLSAMHMGAELLKAQDCLQQMEQNINALNSKIDSTIISSNSL